MQQPRVQKRQKRRRPAQVATLLPRKTLPIRPAPVLPPQTKARRLPKPARTLQAHPPALHPAKRPLQATAQRLLPRARKTLPPVLQPLKPPRARQRRPRPGQNLPKRQQTTAQRSLQALPVPPAALQALPPRRPLQQNPARIMLPAVQRLPKAPKLPLPNLPRGQPTRKLPQRPPRALLRRQRRGLILRQAAQAKRPQPRPAAPQRPNPARLLPPKAQMMPKIMPRRWLAL